MVARMTALPSFPVEPWCIVVGDGAPGEIFVPLRDEPLAFGDFAEDEQDDLNQALRALNDAERYLQKAEADAREKVGRTWWDAERFVEEAEASLDEAYDVVNRVLTETPWFLGVERALTRLGARLRREQALLQVVEEAFEAAKLPSHLDNHGKAFEAGTRGRVRDVYTYEMLVDSFERVYRAACDPEAEYGALYTESPQVALEEARVQAEIALSHVVPAEWIRWACWSTVKQTQDATSPLMQRVLLDRAQAHRPDAYEALDYVTGLLPMLEGQPRHHAVEMCREALGAWAPGGERSEVLGDAWRLIFYEGFGGRPGIRAEFEWLDEEVQRVQAGVAYLDAAWRCLSPEARMERVELRDALEALVA